MNFIGYQCVEDMSGRAGGVNDETLACMVQLLAKLDM